MKSKQDLYYYRGISGAEVARRVESKQIFSNIYYDYDGGQAGVHFWVFRDNLEAFITRHPFPIDDAYQAKPGDPKRLTHISLRKVKYHHIYAPTTKIIGEYDNIFHRPMRNGKEMEIAAKKDTILRRFLDDVLNVFNSAIPPLMKRKI